MTLSVSTPWSLGQAEDRRFRSILLQTLVITLIIGAITPSIELPVPELIAVGELPARRVRLLPEPSIAALRAAPVESATVVPRPSLAQKPPAQPEPAPAVTPTPRQKAAQSGVLALSEALGELQAMAPRVAAGPQGGRTAVSGGARGYPAESEHADASTLTANLGSGSGGVGGGIAHQAALGGAGLPERTGSGLAAGLADGSGAASGEISSGPSRVVRSQEQIQEVLDRNKGAMYTVYSRELRSNASLQGRLVLEITVAPQGHVTRCIVVSNELESISLEQQLVALVRRIDFGAKPGAAAVTTKIPIEFFPQ